MKESNITIKHDICPHGCYLYLVRHTDLTQCQADDCNLPRYRNSLQYDLERNDVNRDPTMSLPELMPNRQITYTSIGKALTELWADDEKLDILNYGHDFLSDNYENSTGYKDVFS
ncbi:hypothetical protein A0J61_11700, partial [Choanephora cucurbitarum]